MCPNQCKEEIDICNQVKQAYDIDLSTEQRVCERNQLKTDIWLGNNLSGEERFRKVEARLSVFFMEGRVEPDF